MLEKDFQPPLITPSKENNYFREIGEIQVEELITDLQREIFRKATTVYEVRKNFLNGELAYTKYFSSLMKKLEFNRSKVHMKIVTKSGRYITRELPWDGFAYEVTYDDENNINGMIVDVKITDGENKDFFPVEIYRENLEDEAQVEVFDALLRGAEEIEKSLED
jgi:hypothetical protein